MSDGGEQTRWLTPAQAQARFPGYQRGESLAATTPEQLDSLIADRLGFCDLRRVEIVSVIRIRDDRADYAPYRAYFYVYDAESGQYTFL